jgi:hypothetical protein
MEKLHSLQSGLFAQVVQMVLGISLSPFCRDDDGRVLDDRACPAWLSFVFCIVLREDHGTVAQIPVRREFVEGAV